MSITQWAAIFDRLNALERDYAELREMFRLEMVRRDGLGAIVGVKPDIPQKRGPGRPRTKEPLNGQV